MRNHPVKTYRFVRGTALGLLLGLLLHACDGGTGPIPEDAVGVYSLISVGGNALPAALGPATEHKLTAMRGDLVLREDGEYRQIIQTRYVSSEGHTTTGVNTTAGEFDVEGSRIELQEDLGPTRAGTLASGDIRYEITVAGVPVALRWQK